MYTGTFWWTWWGTGVDYTGQSRTTTQPRVGRLHRPEWDDYTGQSGKTTQARLGRPHSPEWDDYTGQIGTTTQPRVG